VPVLENIGSPAVGAAQFDVSGSGSLAYLANRGSVDAIMSWVDRSGKSNSVRATAVNWANARFSPDGQRLAVNTGDGTQTGVWIYEWERDTFSRLPTGTVSIPYKPIWTPDGRGI